MGQRAECHTLSNAIKTIEEVMLELKVPLTHNSQV